MNEPEWLWLAESEKDDLSGMSSVIIALIVYASILIQVLLVYS